MWSIKILLITFCQEGPQMLCAKFRANWWNSLGGVWKSRFSIFCDVVNKKRWRKWAWPIPRHFSTIHWTREYKVFECVTKCLGVISQNALSSITAPSRLEIQDDNRLQKNLPGVTYICKFGEFWGVFRKWKMRSFWTKESFLKKIKKIKNHLKYNRVLAGSLLGP